MPRSLLIACLLLPLPLAAGAEVYKWTDENGQVHYGSRAGDEDAVSIKIDPAPELPDNHARRMEKQRRLLKLYEEEREEKRQQKARAEKEKQKRLANCQRARDYYKNIKSAASLYEIDEQGKQVILDEPRRRAEESRIAQYMDDWCN